MVPQLQHAVHLGATGREDMEVHRWTPPLEKAVLAPLGLAKMQHVAHGRQGGHVRGFVHRVGNDERDVQDRLGRQSGHRGGPYVLDPHRTRTKDSPNTSFLILVVFGPTWIGVTKHHNVVQPLVRPQILHPRRVRHSKEDRIPGAQVFATPVPPAVRQLSVRLLPAAAPAVGCRLSAQ